MPGSRAAVLLACCATAIQAVGPLGLTAGRAEAAAPGQFDLQAHRGGLGLVTESTLEAFANALELGVTSLELDVRLTEDGHPVVTHDRRVSAIKCRDTAPAFAGDPEFPYVGELVLHLSVAQVSTLDCGWQQLPGFPFQRVVAGARMPLLSEVFDLIACYDAKRVRVGIDPKFAADAPRETAPRRQLVRVVAREVRGARMLERVTIQSSDWRILMRMRRLEPGLPIVAAASGSFLQAGKPGASPWLGGIDIDDFHGSLVAAAASFGADGIAPYAPYVTRRLVRQAHDAGMTVLAWTVDDPATMSSLIDARVDGIITDYPDRLRALLTRRGLRPPAPAPRGNRGCVAPGLLTGGVMAERGAADATARLTSAWTAPSAGGR